MVQTVTIDVIDEKAMQLLQDLELLQLIHIRKEKAKINWTASYEGGYI